MDREILFRGECVETSDWVKGHYVRLFDDKGNRHHRIYPGYAESDCGDLYPDWYEVDPNTVEQFTGLTDKNGKKIFEGDIIQHGKRKGRIFYYGNFGMFMISWIPNGGANIFMNVLHAEVEVIGNIHDNPELVNEK